VLVLGRHEQLPPTSLFDPWIPALGIHHASNPSSQL
jgi:hypothetical protein